MRYSEVKSRIFGGIKRKDSSKVQAGLLTRGKRRKLRAPAARGTAVIIFILNLRNYNQILFSPQITTITYWNKNKINVVFIVAWVKCSLFNYENHSLHFFGDILTSNHHNGRPEEKRKEGKRRQKLLYSKKNP